MGKVIKFNVITRCRVTTGFGKGIFMRFYSLSGNDKTEEAILKAQFDSGHQIGVVSVADDYLFVKKRLKTFFISYKDADRIFKRVCVVTANICCEGGDLRFDYLVVYKDSKLIEVQLPGEKAARILFDELKEKAPFLCLTAPEKKDADTGTSPEDDRKDGAK